MIYKPNFDSFLSSTKRARSYVSRLSGLGELSISRWEDDGGRTRADPENDEAAGSRSAQGSKRIERVGAVP